MANEDSRCGAPSTNWLITGGCGFVGINLIRRLLGSGDCAIRVVDNLSVGTRDDLAEAAPGFEEVDRATALEAGEVQLLVGDILDEKLALDAARDADVVVHLAANTGVQPSIEDPRKDLMCNVVGTFNYLEAARVAGARRFVFASSGGTVIGESDPPIHEELVPHPVSPYGASKSAGEGYLSAYFGTYGLETVALRFGNVYGPGSGRKNSVVAKFIRRAVLGEPLEIYGDGTQTRDFIYIDDLVGAIVLAATRTGIGGNVFQIASGCETTVNEIAQALLPVLERHGRRPEVRYSAPLHGEIRRNYADTSRARELLGWTPATSLAEGLTRTVGWFVDNARR